jgi:hypothetical protein
MTYRGHPRIVPVDKDGSRHEILAVAKQSVASWNA